MSRVLLLFLCGSSLLFSTGTTAVKSKHACQGAKLRLHCKDHYALRFYSANYGRLEPGSSICPSKNITTLKCRAPNVLLKMATRCANKQRCVVKVDQSTFGDPCPGTFKYLDVIYRCELTDPGAYWTPTPTSKSTKHQNRTKATTTQPSSRAATSKTVKLSTTQKTSRLSASGTTWSNVTSNMTASTTPTRGKILKVTTRRTKPTGTVLPPKAPKVPKAKESGSGGEEGLLFALLRSLYFTYRFMEDSPRQTLVVFLSSVAGSTVLLLLLLITIHICKKHRRKRKFAVKRKASDLAEEGNKIKSVTIEIQGSDDETKEINVNPGDIIIIDHNDANQSGSEDLGYLSEIVRFYNSQNIGSDDQISIRKQFSHCDSPSVISTSESRDSKYDSTGINNKQCTCQQGALLLPSSPPAVM